MNRNWKHRIKRWNRILHRDVGYFLSGLIIAYSISGIALNHIDDWNPDFVIHKNEVSLDRQYQRSEIGEQDVERIGALVGEQSYKVYDFPTNDQLKIYYENATLHINLKNQKGVYERVLRRPLIYETNVLHRNSVQGWKWASDVFALFLIGLNITGLFILKGRTGLAGRGKWFIVAGMAPPIAALVIFNLIQ